MLHVTKKFSLHVGRYQIDLSQKSSFGDIRTHKERPYDYCDCDTDELCELKCYVIDEISLNCGTYLPYKRLPDPTILRAAHTARSDIGYVGCLWESGRRCWSFIEAR